MLVALNNGLKMPILGLGTFLAPKDDCENAVYNAIKIGYRLIDTASGYNNQKFIGAAIKRAIGEGIVKREDLFITTKLWVTDWKPEDMERAIKTCLDDLQLDYLDLYLIHNASVVARVISLTTRPLFLTIPNIVSATVSIT